MWGQVQTSDKTRLALKFSGQDRKAIASLFDGISYLSLSAIDHRTALALKADDKLLKDIENIKNNL